jgi:ribokinase
VISSVARVGDRLLSTPHIAVVGSYATGLTLKVKRLPSPGETVLASGYRVDYGGKGSNQAVGCARLGAQVTFMARIGTDNFGDMAQRLYREEGINLEFVRQCDEHPTGVGFILVEEGTGNNCIALDPGANELLSADEVRQGNSVFKNAGLILTQLEIPVGAAEAALACGRANGATTILNPAPVRPLPASVLRLVDVLTPNQSEAKVLTERSASAEADPEDMARDLIHLGAKNVVITLGERGAILVGSSSSTHIPATKMCTVDTTGAGDAFNAGLAMALASGEDLESAVEFAVVTAGLAVTKEGVIPSLPTRAEVIHFYGKRGTKVPGWLLSVDGATRAWDRS